MGRKKRKAVELDPENDEDLAAYMPPKEETSAAAAVVEATEEKTKTSAPAASSSYAVTSHSAEIVGEDIYVSEGSEGEEEEVAEVVLAGSRMGLMRRGLHQPAGLMQPNRQWQREPQGGNVDEDKQEEEKREQELAQLDPVARANLLQMEKQRKQALAMEVARLHESQENAGRDPCLFSKRTAFDIRLDQIEDKPWNNGSDITEYFNYGFHQQDWEQYAANQLEIRQELTDASRQKRPPDPNIVPVTPKTPSKQAPRVAVAVRDPDDANDEAGQAAGGASEGPAIGPEMVKKEDKMDVDQEGDDDTNKTISDIGGGAWAAGATPGSKLAKLIDEQERKNAAAAASAPPPYQQRDQGGDRYSNSRGPPDDYYGGGGQDQYSPNGPPRGGHFHGNGPPPSFRGRGRGGFRPPNPNMPPPWAGRGHRGGYRGGRGGYGRF